MKNKNKNLPTLQPKYFVLKNCSVGFNTKCLELCVVTHITLLHPTAKAVDTHNIEERKKKNGSMCPYVGEDRYKREVGKQCVCLGSSTQNMTG
jgi:hypothetical protein